MAVFDVRRTLRIEEYDSLHRIGPVQWNALADRCPHSSVFQRWEWMLAWWEAIGASRARLRLFAAFENDQLLGIAPLHEALRHGAESRRLSFVGEGHADYQCILASGGSIRTVEALLDAAQSSLSARGRLCLTDVQQFSPVDLVLRAKSFVAPARTVMVASMPCPRMHLRGAASEVEQYLRKRSLRRHAAGLAKLGKVTVVHTGDPGEISRHLDRFFEQHISRWRPTSHPSLFLKEENRQFYARLTEALGATGRVVFTILAVDQQPVAYHFGLRSADDLLWYKPSFDNRLARFSPGEVLLKALLEFAANNDFAAFDFTRGDESFKRRFSTVTNYNVSYVLCKQAWRGGMLLCDKGLRSAGRRVRKALRRGYTTEWS